MPDRYLLATKRQVHAFLRYKPYKKTAIHTPPSSTFFFLYTSNFFFIKYSTRDNVHTYIHIYMYTDLFLYIYRYIDIYICTLHTYICTYIYLLQKRHQRFHAIQIKQQISEFLVLPESFLTCILNITEMYFNVCMIFLRKLPGFSVYVHDVDSGNNLLALNNHQQIAGQIGTRKFFIETFSNGISMSNVILINRKHTFV